MGRGFEERKLVKKLHQFTIGVIKERKEHFGNVSKIKVISKFSSFTTWIVSYMLHKNNSARLMVFYLFSLSSDCGKEKCTIKFFGHSVVCVKGTWVER